MAAADPRAVQCLSVHSLSDLTNGSPASPESRPILQDNFLLHNKGKTPYTVQLWSSKVTYNVATAGEISADKTVIDFSDIIGCNCLKGKKSGDPSSYLALYTYPSKRKILGKRKVRSRHVVCFTFNKHSTYADNCHITEKWRLVIRCLLAGVEVTIDTNLSTLVPPEPKRMLVLVNPFSGPGKALQIFQERVVPMFAEANIHFNLVVTEYAGHARELVQGLDLNQFYGIIIVSGDGLVYEVINGLMSRPDWEIAIRTKLGILPGGSGNALSSFISYESGENHRESAPLHAAYVIAKHMVCPLDLVGIELCNKKRMYSFLAVAWGLIADIDIESEKYRSLGAARFTLYSMLRIVKLRKYRGRLSFKPVGEYKPGMRQSKSSPENLMENNAGSAGMTHSKSCMEPVLAASGEKRFANGHSAPAAETQVSQDASDATEGLEPVSPTTDPVVNGFESSLPKADPPVTAKEGAEPDPNSNKATLAASNTAPTAGSQPSPKSTASEPVLDLPPLDEPVPSDWVVIEGDFVFAGAIFIKFLEVETMAAPLSKIDDGVLYVSFLRGDAGRLDVLKSMSKNDDGSLQESMIENVAATAFRLEPLTKKGNLTVDGEVVEYGPIQGQVIPGFGRVMAIS